MAGRRRGTAAASAVDLLTKLILRDEERKQLRRERAQEMADKFQQEIALDAYKRGQLVYDPKTGGLSANPNPPKTMEEIIGMGSKGNNGLSPYQLKPKFDEYGRVTGYDTDMQTPQQQVAQGILQTSEADPSSFIPQISENLNRTLPNTPFTPGPYGEGFITGAQEADQPMLPEAQVSREEVIRQLASQGAERFKEDRLEKLQQLNQDIAPQVPMIIPTESGPYTLGTVNRNAKIVSPKDAAMMGDFVPPTDATKKTEPPPQASEHAGIDPEWRARLKKATTSKSQPVQSKSASRDIQSLVNDARQALKEGFSEQDIRKQLTAMGVDQDTINQVISSTGL